MAGMTMLDDELADIVAGETTGFAAVGVTDLAKISAGPFRRCAEDMEARRAAGVMGFMALLALASAGVPHDDAAS